MIKAVYLFTNRVCLFFDEKDNQIVKFQKAIGWRTKWTKKHAEKEREVLEQVIKDQPEIYISKWNEWIQPISVVEFCSLLGHGEWYRNK